MRRKNLFLFASLIAFAFAILSQTAVAGEPPVTLVKVTYVPGIVGDFDHFTVDRSAAQWSPAVYLPVVSSQMFDLRMGDHLQSIGVDNLHHRF
jgi:hypothetical protein